MSFGNHRDRLSWGDALFLYLERAGMPLNIASLIIFEGEISLADCRDFIASKLPLIPRYYQRVVAPPFNIGLPTWEDDPDFDIRNHVRQVTLKKGTDTELKAVTGKMFSTTMDRGRPLWDLILVNGLKHRRTGLIMRVHHCLADGIAGVGLMSVIMDQTPESTPPPKKKKETEPRRPNDPFVSLFELWIDSCSSIVERVLSTQSEVLTVAERVVSGTGELPSGELVRFLPELTMPTDPLFFNVNYRGPQRFCWARIPMEDIKAIKTACGVTHNDVVLTLITATIRRYVELHGDAVKNRLLKIMVPVNLRNPQSADDLGNRISIVPFTVPLGIKHPAKLLAAVHERTEFFKRSHLAELMSLAGGVLATAPTALQAVAGPIASQLPITPFNLVCTNVPGPKTPLYLLGHKMLDWYPYVPVGGNMPLNCAILSYNGTSYFGFSGDVHAAPDLASIKMLLDLSFEELKLAAGLTRPPKQTKKRAVKAKPKVAPPPRKPAVSNRTTAQLDSAASFSPAKANAADAANVRLAGD